MECRGTHREVTANRPDVVIKYKKENICILIYLAIPGDKKVIQNESEKETTIHEFMYM
jgi:hypothetical protein